MTAARAFGLLAARRVPRCNARRGRAVKATMAARSTVIAVLLFGARLARADDAPPGDTPPAPAAPAPAPIPPAPAEPRPGSFSVGVGFTPDEKLIATAGIASTNLFHTGQQLALDAQLSAIHQRFTARWVLPDVAHAGLDLETQLVSDRRELPGFERQGAGGAVSLVRHLDAATRVFATLRAERVVATPDGIAAIPTASAIAPPSPASLADPQSNSIITAGGGIEYETRDSPIPRHGTHFDFLGERAMPALGSDVSLTRFSAHLEHAETFGPFTLRASGRAAYVTSSDPGGVPMSERLYFMGNGDVRGFAMSANDTGGNAIANGHLELEVPVWRRAGLSLAGFYDAGVEQNRDLAFGPLATVVRKSVGGSVIWRSPIGPLRFDLAVPLDDPTAPKRFLFSFGTGF